MANATPLLSKLVLDHMFGITLWTPPAGIYLALFTDAGATVEVVGGSYIRKQVTAPAVIAGQQQTANNAPVSFTSMPACQVVAGALMTAVSAGDKYLFVPVPVPIGVLVGDTVTFANGQITSRAA